MSTRRFTFVDALRGMAALWIVLYHAVEGDHAARLEPVLPGLILRVLHSGFLAVPVFFALSGFVIAQAIGQRRMNLRFAAWFMSRRVLRLTPPYWASIVFTLAVQPWSGDSNNVPLEPWSVIAHLFYLQDILRLQPISPIYWTLCLELQFYAVLCALLAVANRIRPVCGERWALPMVVIPAALLSAAWPIGLVHGNLWPGLFPPMLPCFLIGALGWWALDGALPRGWFYLFGALLIGGDVHLGNRFALIASLTALLLLHVGRAGKLSDWLNWRVLQLLGLISYSLYLIHNPVTGVFVFYTLDRLTPRTAGWDFFWMWGIIGATCLSALAFWWLIEQPSIALSRRVKPRRA